MEFNLNVETYPKARKIGGDIHILPISLPVHVLTGNVNLCSTGFLEIPSYQFLKLSRLQRFLDGIQKIW